MTLRDDVHRLVLVIPTDKREGVLRYWGQVLVRELLARIPDLPADVTAALHLVSKALAGDGDLMAAARATATAARATATAARAAHAAYAAARATAAAARATHAAYAAVRAAYPAAHAADAAAHAADAAYAAYAAEGIGDVLLANLAVFA